MNGPIHSNLAINPNRFDISNLKVLSDTFLNERQITLIVHTRLERVICVATLTTLRDPLHVPHEGFLHNGPDVHAVRIIEDPVRVQAPNHCGNLDLWSELLGKGVGELHFELSFTALHLCFDALDFELEFSLALLEFSFTLLPVIFLVFE